jgi:hypothetical protein
MASNLRRDVHLYMLFFLVEVSTMRRRSRSFAAVFVYSSIGLGLVLRRAGSALVRDLLLFDQACQGGASL